MRISLIRFTIILLVLLLSMGAVSSVYALKIADFYRSAKPGEWIEMKSSDGLITKTTVIDIKNGILEVEIKSLQKGQIISVAREFINIEEGRIVLIRIKTSAGEVREIYPEQADDFMKLDFQKRGEDVIDVAAGEFQCERYRAIYNDYVIDVWINENVPVIRLVKVKMRGTVVSLVDYGVRKID